MIDAGDPLGALLSISIRGEKCITNFHLLHRSLFRLQAKQQAFRFAASTASPRTMRCMLQNSAAMGGSQRLSSANRPMHQAGAAAMWPIPPRTANLQHEVELVVALAKGGSNIPWSRR